MPLLINLTDTSGLLSCKYSYIYNMYSVALLKSRPTDFITKPRSPSQQLASFGDKSVPLGDLPAVGRLSLN